ncbi:LuxR C-terminal-related transcriptional regulator [Streptomyces sp. NPDC050485]|uniref:helix-turn-helix transcriptional regulator n=1 Tax=Streptomyces sp. NPDC050485 TaxID=3365617 RepID=UPI0037AEA866
MYKCAARFLRFSVADLAAETGLPEAEVESVLRRLTALRLLRRSTAHPDLLTTVSPESAREQVTRPMLQQISLLQADADRLRDQLDQLVPLGAEIRTLGDGFNQLIVFDREVAVIQLRGNPLGAALIRDPHAVDFIVAAFERAWAAAVPFPTAHGRAQAIAASENIKADIVRLLTAGDEDKAVARRVGMSIRTCQRHITEIMNRLGARNRVQLGHLLHQQEATASAYFDSTRPSGSGPAVSASHSACQAESPG